MQNIKPQCLILIHVKMHTMLKKNMNNSGFASPTAERGKDIWLINLPQPN